MRKVVFGLVLLGFSVANGQSVTFTSSDLPIVVITTGGKQIVDEPKVIVNMGIIDNGPGVKNNITDPFNNYNGKVGIEVRGSSSQSFPKKQYSIELRDNNNVDIRQSLLGMPAEGDWILFAPYNDKTLMRDALAYKLARATGRYASRSRFCELVLDGDYKGVYVLLEKIKRSESRVDIADLDPDENSGDELSGGYIIKIDKTSGGSIAAGFNSPFHPNNAGTGQSIFFQYEYPKYENISEAQKSYISGFISQFETALDGPDFKDPSTGYQKYINVSSFIDYFIVNEISKNVDAYRLSTFMYKEKDSDGGRLHMGPVWDYNLGFGNANYCTNSSPNGFVTDFNAICPSDYWLIPFWWDRLWEDTEYRALVYSRWKTLRTGPFETSKIIGYIDSVATQLNKGPQQRNFVRWPVLGKYVWPNPPDYASLQTYDAEVNWLKNWVTARLAFLDGALAHTVSGVDTQTPAEISITPYPNPFTSDVSFEYSISEPGNISIAIYDALGRGVGRVEESRAEPGTYTTSTSLASQSAGLYFYQMKVDGKVAGQGHLSKR